VEHVFRLVGQLVCLVLDLGHDVGDLVLDGVDLLLNFCGRSVRFAFSFKVFVAGDYVFAITPVTPNATASRRTTRPAMTMVIPPGTYLEGVPSVLRVRGEPQRGTPKGLVPVDAGNTDKSRTGPR